MFKKLSAIFLVTSLFTLSVQAESVPVMFSSLNDFNAPNATEVKGANLSVLHGKVDKVTGVNFSLLGLAETNTMTGVNFDLFWGANKVNNKMTGASLGLFNWMPGETVGANLGFVNYTGEVKGANIGALNYSEGNTLVDVAFGNISQQSTVQVGIFNITKQIDGAQIGLINCADNGFFKCFPFVNFAK